jgi:hypothetical protein
MYIHQTLENSPNTISIIGRPLLLLPEEELQSSEAPAALLVVVLPGPRITRQFSTCAADTEL